VLTKAEADAETSGLLGHEGRAWGR
jgi:hypothetical protein